MGRRKSGWSNEELRNEASFSSSRARILNECGRAYWYQVYASWKGWWSDGVPPESKEAESAYWAKHQDTAPALSGRIVHEAAAWGLECMIEGRDWSREELRGALTSRAKSRLDIALKAAREKTGSNPKKTTRLVEIENGMEWSEEELRDRTRDRLIALTSDNDTWTGDLENENLYLRACSRPERIISVDKMLQYRHDGVLVFIAADLMMKSAKGRGVVIIDWKTGKPQQKDEDQIIHYAAWAAEREFEFATMLLVYLEDGKAKTVAIGYPMEEARRLAVQAIDNFTTDLRKRLVDGDLIKNTPIESEFKPTADVSSCRTCSFQKICERDGTKPSKPSALPGVDRG